MFRNTQQKKKKQANPYFLFNWDKSLILNINVYFQVLRSLAYKDAKAVGDEWEPVVEGNKKVNNHIPPTCLVNIVCNLSFDYNLSGWSIAVSGWTAKSRNRKFSRVHV